MGIPRANERQPDVLASLVGQRLPLKTNVFGRISPGYDADEIAVIERD
jgi:hypothetical protein